MVPPWAGTGREDGDVRIVVSFVGGRGHLEPLLPLARLAESSGHHVSFAGQAAVVDRLAQQGHQVDAVGPDTLLTAPQPLVAADRAAEQVVMRDHFVTGFGRSRAESLGQLFDQTDVDVVVCDEVDVGAVVAAERRGIRCVSVNVIAAGLLTSPDVVGPAWDGLRGEHGLEPDPHGHRIGGDLAVAPVPRSFRSPAAPPGPMMRFVRPPITDDVPRVPTARRDRSLVYATLGTVFNLESGDLLDRLVHAMNQVADAGDVDVVITTGPHVRIDDLPDHGPRVRIEPFVPQHELLDRCRAIVCHAGSGTLVAALSLGIPVVVLPMGADQPDNADRCDALGVGVVHDPMTVSPADIAGSTDAVLHDPRFAAAASLLADEAASQPRIEDVPELADLFASPRTGS